MVRIALNGCGRIGKSFLRALYRDPAARQHVQLVVVNVGRAAPEALAYYIQYDSHDGVFEHAVTFADGVLSVERDNIAVIAETMPSACKWEAYDVDWVVDVTGRFTNRDAAEEHRKSGARGVIISAPAVGDDGMFIMGVNHEQFDHASQNILSLGSCTTNAVVPMLRAVQRLGEVVAVALSTTHAYTNTQSLVDELAHGADVRRFRAAPQNMVPSSTGAVESIQRVMPELVGKMIGNAVRVPLSTVSLVDLVCVMRREVTREEVHEACRSTAAAMMQGIMECTNVPLVSSDFRGNQCSVVIDETLTATVGPCVKLWGWYDNESGYAARMKDFLCWIAASYDR